MSDEFDSQDAPATSGTVVVQRRSCLATLVGSLLTIIVSAALGAALSILFLWYGPTNVGLNFPDSTGRLTLIEHAQQTAVIDRTEMRTTLNGLSDIRGSLDNLREEVQGLRTEVTSRETNLDDLRSQVKSNFESLLVLQKRLDELEAIPANAALANRLADAEVELAQVSVILDRLRQALGAAPLGGASSSSPADTVRTPTGETEDATATPVP